MPVILKEDLAVFVVWRVSHRIVLPALARRLGLVVDPLSESHHLASELRKAVGDLYNFDLLYSLRIFDLIPVSTFDPGTRRETSKPRRAKIRQERANQLRSGDFPSKP